MQENYEVCWGLFHGFHFSKWLSGTPANRLGLLSAERRELVSGATVRRTTTFPGWPPLFVVLLVAFMLPNAFAADGRTVTGTGQQVLKVGPAQQYRRPSEAARVARDGALVEIHAGEYDGDVAVWRQNDLTLRGVGERPHLRAAGRAAEGKAIWVIKGDRVKVENLELSGATVASHNGAAIRAEGAGLTIRDCHFHHNEMGLLTNPSPDSVVVIEESEITTTRPIPNDMAGSGTTSMSTERAASS